jgi:hypothetical protein
MWFSTYHNGSWPDVKSEWHTTSPLVTSVATRCEMSISTDVKCHFCSSVVLSPTIPSTFYSQFLMTCLSSMSWWNFAQWDPLGRIWMELLPIRMLIHPLPPSLHLHAAIQTRTSEKIWMCIIFLHLNMYPSLLATKCINIFI